ncbi:MAG: hypothetical protein HUJ62_04905, partial [Streptococcus gallolyticus]|nr:hypothetical protein [Streptococcus gallolyticus]
MVGIIVTIFIILLIAAVVQAFVSTRDWSKVHKEQVSLSKAYLDDIAKYASA